MKIDEFNRIRVMRVIARMNVGGPAVQVSGLMRGLSSSKFEHRLYTGYCTADEADYLDVVATDLDAIRIGGLGRRVKLTGDIRAFISLVKEIRTFKPNVIHTHTAKAGFLARVASIASLHPSIRVHTFHGHLLNGYFGVFKRTLVIIAEKVLSLFTNQLLAVGERVRQDLLQVGIGSIEKFGLMPPGLILDVLPGKKESQESFGLSVGKLQCAFIGRVTRIKRPDRFLDVVAEIKKRGIEIEFLIAGDGELLGTCIDRITAEELPVKVLGWQGNIERVLAASDIVILTSDNEGTPLSLIQAGMAALPVVTTNVGSIPEVVIDGLTGIVTNVDFMELADALEKLAGDVELRTRMGAAAQEFTMANFGVNRLVHDHEELYKRLISNRAKS
jgi:glycosyltransferase involved in cell wall biosynthesis